MIRLPLPVYWTLAALALVAAAYFTLVIDTSGVDAGDAARLYFTIWGGPVTLLLGALLVTWLRRR